MTLVVLKKAKIALQEFPNHILAGVLFVSLRKKERQKRLGWSEDRLCGNCMPINLQKVAFLPGRFRLGNANDVVSVVSVV